MVSKIEILMVLLIGVSLFVGINYQLEGEALKKEIQTTTKKSIEAINLVGREVNRTEVTQFYQSSKVVLIGEVWYFNEFKLKNRDIKMLKSDKAIRDKRFIKLSGNVKVVRFDDSEYRAKTVIYDTKMKRLSSKGDFQADKNGIGSED